MVKVVIAGAGPAGLLLAHNLCRRADCQVTIVEQRKDPRELAPSERKTYPVGLNKVRGLEALGEIPGLVSACEKLGVWTVGSCIHKSKNGKTRKIVRPTPSLTMDRNNIVLVLLSELLEAPLGEKSSLKIVFDTTVEELDLKKKFVTTRSGSFKKLEQKYFDVLVACDGARSKIREHLVESKLVECETKFIDDEYRSIYLAKESQDGTLPDLTGDTVHAWMVGKIRVIAGPATDGTFSGVYIFPPGEDPFLKLTSGQDVLNYFKELSPGSLWKYVTLTEAAQILERPTSNGLSVVVDRLHVGQSVLLMGDAAHAVTASLGQGCNAAFEDVSIFCKILDESKQDWQVAMESYCKSRLIDVHALHELSTYSTPRTSWMRMEWLIRQMLNMVLPEWLKNFVGWRYLPMHYMATPGMSYSDILEKCRWWTDRVKRSQKNAAT